MTGGLEHFSYMKIPSKLKFTQSDRYNKQCEFPLKTNKQLKSLSVEDGPLIVSWFILLFDENSSTRQFAEPINLDSVAQCG